MWLDRRTLLLLAVVVVAASSVVRGEPEARRGRGRGRGRTPSSESASSQTRQNSKVRKGFNVDFSKDAVDAAADRDSKFFPIFNIVQFKNDPCQSNAGVTGSGNQRNGTCYTTTECSNRGGTASGNCAAGFGVCCVFTIGTGTTTTVSENCTYIQNPSFPGTDTATTSLSYTIQKCSNDVCYLRLDFETFTTQGVGGTNIADEGVCLDMFTITTPTSQMIPTICGQNTGYHMYVDIGANSGDTATLAFTFSGTTTARTWDIKVTQVKCSKGPPDTCLQWHTGLTGRIETFNYQATNDNHLNNQQYSVCIRPECGYCCVQYSLCPDQVAAMAFSLDTGIASSANDDLCLTTDYVSIPESSSVCQSSSTSGARQVNSRYCGVNFNFLAALMVNSQICDCTAPFTVDIYTNNIADINTMTGQMNTIQSRGLCLEYMQVAC